MLVFGSRTGFGTATEPTAYDNTSLSTVGFASPSPDDVTKRRRSAPKAREKVELTSRSSASVVESPV